MEILPDYCIEKEWQYHIWQKHSVGNWFHYVPTKYHKCSCHYESKLTNDDWWTQSKQWLGSKFGFLVNYIFLITNLIGFLLQLMKLLLKLLNSNYLNIFLVTYFVISHCLSQRLIYILSSYLVLLLNGLLKFICKVS